jgi:hypothetical protein
LYALGTLGFFCLFYFYHQQWIHDAEPEAEPEAVLEAGKPDTPELSHAPESSVASFAPDASVTPDTPDPPEEFNDLLNDVYNGTFGVGLRAASFWMRVKVNATWNSSRRSLSWVCHRGQTAVMAWFYRRQ